MEIIKSNTYPHAYRILCARLKARKVGMRHVIVVPDRFSLEAERLALELTGARALMDVEVSTFARLTKELMTQDRRFLSADASAMIVANILRKNADKLRCFRADNAKNLGESVYRTIQQLQASDVSVSDLTVDDGSALGVKAADIALVYAEYLAFLETGYRDAGSALAEAALMVWKSIDRRDRIYHYIGFDSFTKSTLNLMRALDRVSGGSAAYIAGTERALDDASDAIKATFCKEGDRLVYVQAPRQLSAYRQFLYDNLDGDLPIMPTDAVAPSDERIVFYRADTDEDGARYAARTICRAVRNGLRYRDIAIAAADADLAVDALSRAGILANRDQKFALAVHPLARLALTSAAAVTDGYPTAKLSEIAFNPYAAVDAADYTAWNNYCVKFALDRGAHGAPYRYGLTDDAERERTARAERVRLRLAQLLSALDASMRKAKTYGDYADAVASFLAPYAQAELAVEDEYVSFSNQAAKKLDSVLENFRILGNEPCDAADFLSVFETGLKSCEVSVTPTYADAVNVFSPDSFGFREYGLLIWLGANEGELPYHSADCGILSDRDLDKLAAVGTAVEPKIRAVNDRARRRLYATVFACNRLTVISGGVRADGSDPKTSSAAERLRRLGNCTVYTSASFDAVKEDMLTPSAAEKLVFLANGALDAERLYRTLSRYAVSRARPVLGGAACALKAVLDPTEWAQPHRIDRAASLFFPTTATSVTQLETYFRCPYEHFFKYGLRAKEREVGVLRASDIGTALHEVAEKFVMLTISSEAECSVAADRIVEDYIAKTESLQLDNADTVAVVGRIRLEGRQLCRTIYRARKDSSYTLLGAEMAFGDGKDFPPLPVGGDGVTVKLGGKIDRIDADDKKVVVFDYKTGSVSADLKDLYYGKKIQLFIYLAALKKMGYDPVGALYMPVSGDYRTEKNASAPVYIGFLTADVEVATRLDTVAQPRAASEIFPFRLEIKKDTGELYVKENANILKREQFASWLDYAQKLSAGAVKEIVGGYIAPRPLATDERTPCSFCAARARCGDLRICRRHSGKVAKDGAVTPDDEEG